MSESMQMMADLNDLATRPIDVGGRSLTLSCCGHGSPTVVLETGLGAESDEWLVVQRGVQRLTRVCRYDRAGRGSSDPAPRPRSADDMVDDLHALLRVAAIPGPYLLVGHSFGGLLARVYAHRHRDEVIGLVLVDSMHEDQFEVFGPRFPPERPDDPSQLKDMRAFWTGGWRNPNSTQEGIDLVASVARGRSAKSLGDLPVHILTAGTFFKLPRVPAAMAAELQHLWEGLHQQLMGLSPDATRTFVRSSGHFIQREQPEVVVAAIEQMVAALRDRRCAETPSREPISVAGQHVSR